MTSTLQVRIDGDLRQAADKIFADIGMDTNSAIRLFLRQTVIRKTFPFQVIGSESVVHTAAATNASVSRAIEDYENGARHYHIHDLIDDSAEGGN